MPNPVQHFWVGNRVRQWGLGARFEEPNLGTVVEIETETHLDNGELRDVPLIYYKVKWDRAGVGIHEGDKESWVTYNRIKLVE